MSELIKHFGVNGTLLVAQAINFFVVFVVLKLFAFDPILQLLQKRRKDIVQGLALKKESEERLREIDALREAELRHAREQALAIVSEAEQAGKERQNALVNEAGIKSERITEDAKRLIREERAKIREAMADETKHLIRESVVRILGMMPPEERDKRLVEKALQQIKNL